MAHNDDADDLEENGELHGQTAFIGKLAERRTHEKRQDGDDDPGHDAGHDGFKLGQRLVDDLGLGPAHGEPEQQRRDQRAHDGHERRDVQHKGRLRKIDEPAHFRGHGQVRDDGVAGSRRERRRADGRKIGDGHGRQQHLAGVLPQAGDGRRDEAHDDEGHRVENDLPQGVLDRRHGIHDLHVGHAPQKGADGQCHQQFDDQSEIAFLGGHRPLLLSSSNMPGRVPASSGRPAFSSGAAERHAKNRPEALPFPTARLRPPVSAPPYVTRPARTRPPGKRRRIGRERPGAWRSGCPATAPAASAFLTISRDSSKPSPRYSRASGAAYDAATAYRGGAGRPRALCCRHSLGALMKGIA